MIVTFFGHSRFLESKKLEKTLLDLLAHAIGNTKTDFYLGGYGNFDSFAYNCCKKYKTKHSNVSLILVTPYLSAEYQKNNLVYQEKNYDSILYPPIEDKPLKFAIVYRNKYMVESADLVITYVDHEYGGAYRAYKHAIKNCKKVFNLAELKNVY